MTPAEVLGRLRQRGIVIVPAGDGQLRYSPKDLPSSAELAELERCRDAILELLERDPVSWRAAVMVRQITRVGPLPSYWPDPASGSRRARAVPAAIR
ncbi:MAG: hypothetical protein H0X59_07500 [Chloroflexi bacterium]|nr:hypothetical protein [Chloroflexota bacterium]